MADTNTDTTQSAASASPFFVNPAYATPQQLEQMRLYAQQLLKPQPVKHWAQGVGNIAQALIGGNEAYRADKMQQDVLRTKADQLASAYSGGATEGASQPAGGGGPAAGAPMSYARGEAGADSLAPYREAVAANESRGSGDYGALGPVTKAGDRALGRYGVMGANVGPWTEAALGKALTTQEFLADPKAQDAVFNHRFGQYAQKYGPEGAAKAWFAGEGGMNNPEAKDQLGTTVAAYADKFNRALPPQTPQDAITRAVGAPSAPAGPAMAFAGSPAPGGPDMRPMAAQLIAGQGGARPGYMDPAQARRVGAALANPWLAAEDRATLNNIITPHEVQTATGQRGYMSPWQAPNTPFNAGVPLELHPAPGVSVPAIGGGTPQNPTVTTPAISSPGGASGNGSLAGTIAPGTPIGDTIKQAQENQAQGEVIGQQAKANQTRFQQAQETGPQLLAAAYPLRQLQAVLEKNGGVLPSGEGADRIVSTASLVNSIATLLGHPLTDEDSRLTQMELLRKYGGQVQQSLMGRNTDMGAAEAEKISPGIGPTQAANLHLVDNYIRLNALAQKKAQFEHDYYLAHGAGPHAYDNFTQDWLKEISGPKAIPLSKYGRPVTLKNGKSGLYVPSTDPSGFSLFPADSSEFGSSVMTPEKK